MTFLRRLFRRRELGAGDARSSTREPRHDVRDMHGGLWQSERDAYQRRTLRCVSGPQLGAVVFDPRVTPGAVAVRKREAPRSEWD